MQERVWECIVDRADAAEDSDLTSGAHDLGLTTRLPPTSLSWGCFRGASTPRRFSFGCSCRGAGEHLIEPGVPGTSSVSMNPRLRLNVLRASGQMGKLAAAWCSGRASPAFSRCALIRVSHPRGLPTHSHNIGIRLRPNPFLVIWTETRYDDCTRP